MSVAQTPKPKPGKTPEKPKSFRDELPEIARSDWDLATTAYGAKSYAKACPGFRRVYELSKNPKVLSNLAVCEKDAEHFVKAVEALKLQKEVGRSALSAEDLAAADRAISVLEKFTTQVTVDVAADPRATRSVTGAKVYIDDEEQVGTVPFMKAFPIDQGQHKIRVSKEGFKDAIETLVLKEPKTVKLVMEQTSFERATVSVRVDGIPAGAAASVSVDGTVVCKDLTVSGSSCNTEVDAGKTHTFTAVCSENGVPTDACSATTLSREILSKDPTTIALGLAVKEGRIIIDALPKDASIYIDGKQVGSGKWEGKVSSLGSHALSVRRSRYIEHNTEIFVENGKTRTLQIILNQDSGKQVIATVFGAAAVLIGVGIAAGILAANANEPNYVSGSLAPGIVKTTGLSFR